MAKKSLGKADEGQHGRRRPNGEESCKKAKKAVTPAKKTKRKKSKR